MFRKLIFLLLVLAFSTTLTVQAQIWGGREAPVLYVVNDTTSLANDWVSVVSETGTGIIYQIIYNMTVTDQDGNVYVNIDGNIDSTTIGTGEELTTFVIPHGPIAPGENDGTGARFLGSIDSSATADNRFDIPFGNNFEIKAHSDLLSDVMGITVIYGKYE